MFAKLMSGRTSNSLFNSIRSFSRLLQNNFSPLLLIHNRTLRSAFAMSGYRPNLSYRNMSTNGVGSHDAVNGSENAGEMEVRKFFYVEDPQIANATPEQVKEFKLLNNGIKAFARDPNIKIPNPVINFDQAFVCDPEILEAIKHQNFKQPSPIQCQVWPVLLSGHDCISISQTGSGKTLGFLLPGLVHAHNQQHAQSYSQKPSILVICPTRELAIQTQEEVQKYAYRGFNSVCCYGGASRYHQLDVIRKGVRIVVGTPGRLNDFIKEGKLVVNKVTYVVLDEADRMLDMGFEPQIRSILDELPRNRQTVMTSATWPKEAESLASQYLTNPVQIHIGSTDLQAAETITQLVEFHDSSFSKEKALISLLRNDRTGSEKILVFCNTKRMVRQMCDTLRREGIRAGSIHGDLDQMQRERALDGFKENRFNVLTATDVAARGLDVSDISLVINFDMPTNIDEYVHRIGRTGRAGKSGRAISYFSQDDSGVARKLIDVLQKGKQHVDPRLYEYQRFPSKTTRTMNRFRNPQDDFNQGNGGFNRFGNTGGGFTRQNRYNGSSGSNYKREKNDAWD